jgi:hypothetical protein
MFYNPVKPELTNEQFLSFCQFNFNILSQLN